LSNIRYVFERRTPNREFSEHHELDRFVREPIFPEVRSQKLARPQNANCERKPQKDAARRSHFEGEVEPLESELEPTDSSPPDNALGVKLLSGGEGSIAAAEDVKLGIVTDGVATVLVG
jgi:hypothetical protein